MWLFSSSVGKKVVMSVTGVCLILFLTLHALMNAVVLVSEEAYNCICEFLGANWYAVGGTLVLALLAVIHIIYALILTLQNRRARGASNYAVTQKPDQVEWASQNMFVLGLIVVIGLLIHFYSFWYNMMFAELTGIATGGLLSHAGTSPGDGARFIAITFGNPVMALIYIIWFVAIWFHLTHGFWSALQTLGSGRLWFKRWRTIGNVWVTIVMLLFVIVVLRYALQIGL